MMPLEQELQELRYKVLDQAEFVQLQMNACFTALKEPDYLVAKELILQVKESKNSSLDVDKTCENILALYQPSAPDLRFIFAAIRIHQNLHCIGDGLHGISKSLLEANHSIDPAWYQQLQITEMTDVVYEMYTGMISAFIQRSPHIAHAVYMRDHEVDTLKWEGSRLLTDAIKANPMQVEGLLSLIFTLQRIEKLADNICEVAQEICFFVEGKSIRKKES